MARTARSRDGVACFPSPSHGRAPRGPQTGPRALPALRRKLPAYMLTLLPRIVASLARYCCSRHRLVLGDCGGCRGQGGGSKADSSVTMLTPDVPCGSMHIAKRHLFPHRAAKRACKVCTHIIYVSAAVLGASPRIHDGDQGHPARCQRHALLHKGGFGARVCRSRARSLARRGTEDSMCGTTFQIGSLFRFSSRGTDMTLLRRLPLIRRWSSRDMANDPGQP